MDKKKKKKDVLPEEQPRPFGILKDKYPDISEEDFFALDEEIAKDFEGEQ